MGAQIRRILRVRFPHVVWFGEQVPMLDIAAKEVETADLLIIIGTSLKVYPAASLIHFTKPEIQIVLIDPEKPDHIPGHVHWIDEKASTGVERLVREYNL